MESLTQKVLEYQKTGHGLREIVNEIGPRIYQFPRRTMGWDEDACGDFFVFIHPRLIRLLDRFRDQGRPFESYLWTVLNWQLRNFARDRSRADRRWQVSLRIDPGETVRPDAPAAVDGRAGPGCAEDGCTAEALQAPTALARCIRSDADRRNFLFLVLKCSRRMEGESVPALARLAGIHPERLRALAGELADRGRSREARHEMFRDRRNRAYAAGRLLEQELKSEVDAGRRAALERALHRMRRRMTLAMQHLSRVGQAPTNAEIGAVLGVPKGTVDSGLYWLKRKLASVYDPDTLRSAS